MAADTRSRNRATVAFGYPHLSARSWTMSSPPPNSGSKNVEITSNALPSLSIFVLLAAMFSFSRTCGSYKGGRRGGGKGGGETGEARVKGGGRRRRGWR